MRPQKHLLREVRRVFVVAHKAKAQAVHRPLVQVDDQIQRARTAGQTSPHQLWIGAVAGCADRDQIGGFGQQVTPPCFRGRSDRTV